jgi:hypothetical protein
MTNRVCFLFWRGRGLFARGNVFFLAGYISLLVGRGLIEIFEHAYHLQIFLVRIHKMNSHPNKTLENNPVIKLGNGKFPIYRKKAHTLWL